MVAPLLHLTAPTGVTRVVTKRVRVVAAPKPNAVPVKLAQRAPLSTADRLWLQLPNMVIHTALTFDTPVTRADVVELVRTRVLAMPRFRRRLVPQASPPQWEEVQTAPEQHVRTLRVTGMDGAAMMRSAVEQLKAEPIDLSRAPWDMTLVQGDGPTSVLVTRIHHAVSDGRGLVDAILSCDESGRTIPIPAAAGRASTRTVLHLLRAAVAAFASFCKLTCRRRDPLSSLKRPQPVSGLSVAWLPRHWPLTELKAIAAVCGGGTVNDVVLTAVAGALRRYMQSKNDPVDRLRIRCLLPFNLAATQKNSDKDSGNFVGGGLCPLPIHLSDAKARFRAVHGCMQALKASPEPAVGARIMSVLNGAPAWLRRPMHRFAAAKCTVFVSNVRGPEHAMRVMGHKVEDILWFVPPLLNIGLGFPVMSYEGRLSMGISADPLLVPDMATLQGFLEAEYANLRSLV